MLLLNVKMRFSGKLMFEVIRKQINQRAGLFLIVVTRARDLIEDAEDFLGSALDLFKTGRWSTG
jgi:hypothetical protein